MIHKSDSTKKKGIIKSSPQLRREMPEMPSRIAAIFHPIDTKGAPLALRPNQRSHLLAGKLPQFLSKEGTSQPGSNYQTLPVLPKCLKQFGLMVGSVNAAQEPNTT